MLHCAIGEVAGLAVCPGGAFSCISQVWCSAVGPGWGGGHCLGPLLGQSYRLYLAIRQDCSLGSEVVGTIGWALRLPRATVLAPCLCGARGYAP